MIHFFIFFLSSATEPRMNFDNLKLVSFNSVIVFFVFFFSQKNSHDLALTLDNAKKLMMMGISKDLGKCKDVRRSDNRPCGNFVNRYKLSLSLVSNVELNL